MRFVILIVLIVVLLTGCGEKQFTEADLNGIWESVYAEGTVGVAGSSTGDTYRFSFNGASGTVSKSGWITGPQRAEVTTIMAGEEYNITCHNSHSESMTFIIKVENKDKLLMEMDAGGGTKFKENLIRQ